MPVINKICIPGCIVSIIFFLFSCKENENHDPDVKDHQENQWMEETMRRYYLWYNEIKDKPDKTMDAESFFLSMLSSKDGKDIDKDHYYYSYIEKKTGSSTKSYQGKGYSFGFEFQYYRLEGLDKYALLILYVLPGSPADSEGLKRGDWIMEINGSPVPGDGNSLLKALDTTSPVAVVFATTRNPRQPVTGTKSVTPAEVEDNPVFLSKIIEYEGRRIAYLVYNHFTSGPSDNPEDEMFNNTLRDVFSQFKADAPDEFILDLRYNGGGLVSSAQLLSTMLAPASALNDVFCKLTYNGRANSYSDHTISLSSEYMRQGSSGENLGLNRLYVIASSRTASASEAVVNGLRPYMNVTLIGGKTEGKNVGSVTFSDNRFEWELHPIVSRLSNKDGFSEYDKGFEPDFPCDESRVDEYYELGDEREYMLQIALKYITGAIRPGSSPRSHSISGLTLTPLYNSLDRKKTNGVLLDR